MLEKCDICRDYIKKNVMVRTRYLLPRRFKWRELKTIRIKAPP